MPIGEKTGFGILIQSGQLTAGIVFKEIYETQDLCNPQSQYKIKNQQTSMKKKKEKIDHSQGKNWSIKTNSKMTQMLEFAENNFEHISLN